VEVLLFSEISPTSHQTARCENQKKNVTYQRFLGAFAQFWKAAIGFFISVCPSVNMEHIGYRWTDFHEI
jgi:hypothetical protein